MEEISSGSQVGTTIVEPPLVTNGLTPRNLKFAEYVALYDNPHKAASLAGYNVVQDPGYPYKLMRDSRIQSAVAHYKEVFSRDTLSYTPEKIRRLYELMAHIEIADVCNDDWTLKPKSQWTAEQRAALIGIEVTLKGGQRFVKPKFAKLEAGEMLAKLHRMLSDDKDSGGPGFNLNITLGAQAQVIDNTGESRTLGHINLNQTET